MDCLLFFKKEKYFSYIVFILVAIAFIPSLFNGFVDWDDLPLIILNDDFKGLGIQNLKWMFTTFHMSHYQPLSWLSLAIDWKLWGMNPFGYHLTNVLLHAASAAFLYKTAFILFTVNKKDISSDNLVYASAAAVFSALFFAIHPLRAESVSWLTERRDVLSLFFFIVSLFIYVCLQSDAISEEKKHISENISYGRRLLLCFIVYVMACLSKSMAVTLPAVFVLLDFYPFRRLPASTLILRERDSIKAVKEKIPFFIFAAALSLFYYFVVGKAIDIPYIDSYKPSFAKAVYANWFYLFKTVFPIGLSPVYAAPEHGYLVPNIIGGSALFFLLCYAFRLRHSFPVLLTAALYYFGTLFPACGLLNGAPVPAADRYSYIPGIGPAVLAGAVFLNCLNNPDSRKRAGYAALIIIILMSVLCSRQQSFWKGSTSVWTRAASAEPRSAIAYNNLASLAFARGNREEAEKLMLKALSLAPDDFNIHFNCGNLYLLASRYQEAAVKYSYVIKLAPDYYLAYIKLAEAELKLGNAGEAEEALIKATEKRPAYFQAWHDLAIIKMDAGKYSEAEPAIRNALSAVPDSEEMLIMMSAALAGQGRYSETVDFCHKVLELNPKNGEASAFLQRLEKAANGNGKNAK